MPVVEFCTSSIAEDECGWIQCSLTHTGTAQRCESGMTCDECLLGCH